MAGGDASGSVSATVVPVVDSVLGTLAAANGGVQHIGDAAATGYLAEAEVGAARLQKRQGLRNM